MRRQFGRKFGMRYIEVYQEWKNKFGSDYLFLHLIQMSYIWINKNASHMPGLAYDALPQ